MPTALESEIQLAHDLHNLASREAEIGDLERAVIDSAIEYVEGSYHDNNRFDQAVRALIAAREKQ